MPFFILFRWLHTICLSEQGTYFCLPSPKRMKNHSIYILNVGAHFLLKSQPYIIICNHVNIAFNGFRSTSTYFIACFDMFFRHTQHNECHSYWYGSITFLCTYLECVCCWRWGRRHRVFLFVFPKKLHACQKVGFRNTHFYTYVFFSSLDKGKTFVADSLHFSFHFALLSNTPQHNWGFK